MKLAGMFTEVVKLRPPTPQPSIHDNIAAEPLPDVEQVVAYLRAGHQLISAISLNDDVLDSSRSVMGGYSVMTDGDWLWREDLAYYVSRYNVLVPEEFLALIRERGYVVPSADDAVLDKCADYAAYIFFYGKQLGE